ncbi:MAG: M20/M25/M40 family metallo-hydrolase [Clostridia bacterium]|nr:M20/M25/M40 family metallo-hydrolase [Clostridia bacterium]
MKDIKEFISQNKDEMYKILMDLCLIPAPSHFEHQRAEYCKNWLSGIGAKGVYIDEALNVIFPINCDESGEITVIVAHTDTVFPDTDPLPCKDDGEKIHSPGVGDDTACVAQLLITAKYFVENNITPQKGIMFVCNSCEEGLGNLKGTRQIFKDFEGRIAKFISFDAALGHVSDTCVGSHRYEVEVLTEGGHSFGAFGNNNAIAKLAEIVSEIYKIEVTKKEGTKTTYNVGTINGGTSVNTIAQNAKMLCEYRSDDYECLEFMKEKFQKIFESARSEKVVVNVTNVGDRPCGNIEQSKIDNLKALICPIIEETTGKEVLCRSSSTDCNIPLSLGVPALCIGTRTGNGAHTRDEWVDKASMIPGLEIAIKTSCALGEV